MDRVRCRSQQQELELQLDVNCEIYPLPEGAAFSLALAPTLSPDGAPDGDTFDQSGAKSLADGYEYVMHGMVFKIEEGEGRGETPGVRAFECARTRARACVRVCVRVCACVCVFVCAHARAFARTRVCVCACLRTHQRTRSRGH